MNKLGILLYRIVDKVALTFNQYFLLNTRIWLFERYCLDLYDYNGTIFRKDLEDSYNIFLTKEQSLNHKFMSKLLKDVIRCYILYYITPDEYFLHDLMHKDEAFRKNILSRHLKDIYCIESLGKDWKFYFNQLKDKWSFYELAQAYFKRDVCRVTDEDWNSVKEFCKKHKKFIAKPRNSSCGIGVHSVDMEKFDNDIKKVFDYYKDMGGNQWMFEEYIKQSSEMSVWHPASVNTIRIPSVRTKEGPVVILPLFRVGKNGNFVDNCHNDGGFMSVPNAQTGIIESDGLDVFTNHYECHINSGLKFKGWQVPRWNELIQIAKELHMSLPKEHKYVGFDFALTDDRGWVVVEGNWGNFPHQVCLGKGIKEEFENLMYS